MLDELYLFGQEHGMYENDNKLVVYFCIDDVFTENDVNVEIFEPDGYIPGYMAVSGQVQKKSETNPSRSFKKSFEFKVPLTNLKINSDIILETGKFEIVKGDDCCPNKIKIYFDLVNNSYSKLKHVNMNTKSSENNVDAIGKIGRKIENGKLTFKD